MNYSEPLINQVTVFFRALGCGILLGIFYDLVSAVRMTFGERKVIYVFFDTLYMVLAAVMSFFFMVLYNSGQVRLNLIFAEFIGCTAFHFSFGKYILKRYSVYLSRIRKFFSFAARPFVALLRKLQKIYIGILSSLKKKSAERNFFDIFSKKLSDISKIHLKNKNKSV